MKNIAAGYTDGSIEFERSGHKVQGNSCYQIGSTLQLVKKLVSPAAAGKGAGEKNAYQTQVNDLIMVRWPSLIIIPYADDRVIPPGYQCYGS